MAKVAAPPLSLRPGPVARPLSRICDIGHILITILPSLARLLPFLMGVCRQESQIIIRTGRPLALLKWPSRPFYTVPLTKNRPPLAWHT